VVPTLSFVAALVVARCPRHHVLVVPYGHVVDEVLSLATTQHCGPSTMVLDDDIAVLPSCPRETEGVTHRFEPQLDAVRRSCPVDVEKLSDVSDRLGRIEFVNGHVRLSEARSIHDPLLIQRPLTR
jgi:hypothetical protein